MLLSAICQSLIKIKCEQKSIGKVCSCSIDKEYSLQYQYKVCVYSCYSVTPCHSVIRYIVFIVCLIKQRASERLRHALHRVQRSDSKSETELEKYSVKPRPRKLKKKKKINVPIGGTNSRRKSPATEKQNDSWKVLQTHKHQFQ